MWGERMTNREKFIEVFGDNPQRHHITKSWWEQEYIDTESLVDDDRAISLNEWHEQAKDVKYSANNSTTIALQDKSFADGDKMISLNDVLNIFGDVHPLDYNARSYIEKIKNLPSIIIDQNNNQKFDGYMCSTCKHNGKIKNEYNYICDYCGGDNKNYKSINDSVIQAELDVHCVKMALENGTNTVKASYVSKVADGDRAVSLNAVKQMLNDYTERCTLAFETSTTGKVVWSGRVIKSGSIIDAIEDLPPITPQSLSVCDICMYGNPSSADGKPCTICPAITKVGDDDAR